ncbi:hypothetical protein J437_LFUL002251 [Ladona fulva]|uniref:Protein broad-minded n=1 Tax=Ladona fulva TaxID=123851 RepID=A0A8K0JY56_LADFU|nr:hypothetical protein J437_LFUL002251 [Ladona fulva]
MYMMDDHATEIKLKQRTMPDGFKDIISKIAAEGNSRGNLDKEDWFYPECALFKSVKMHILTNLNDHILKEIESIRNLGSKYSELSVCTSAKKLLALPEMNSVICDLKEGMDEMLGTYIVSSSRLATSSADSQNSGRSLMYGQNPWTLDSSVSMSDRELNMVPTKLDTIRNKGKIEVILVKIGRASFSEVFETPCWANFKIIIRKSLSDDSSTVFYHALRLHARFLLSSSNVAILESFINLKTSLLEQYVNGKSENDLPNMSEGIVLSRLSHVRLLRVMNLIAKFFRDKSKNYIRLPVTLIEDIIGAMVELLTFTSEESRELYPLHLLSVIDPKALWMQMCFYYTRIRNLLFKKLSENQNLSISFFEGLVSWLNLANVRSKRTCLSADLNQVISENHIKFALFSHSLHLYSFFMDCDKGRTLLWSIEGGTTYQEILRSIISYLNHSTSCRTGLLLQKILHSLISNVKYGVLTNSFVHALVLNPLICSHQSMTLRVDSESDMLIRGFVIELIKTLLISKVGRDKFIVQRFNSESSDVSPAKILLLYASKLLRKSGKTDISLLKSVLMACVSLSFSPKGLVDVEDCDFIPMLGLFYRQLKGEENASSLKSISSYTLISDDISKLELLTSCLTCFTAYSGRVWLIEKEGILLSVLNEVFKQPVIPWNQFWFKKLLISSSLTTSGYDAVAGEKLQSVLLSNLWKFRVLDNDDFSDQMEENLQHELSKVFSLCSTLRGVKAILVDQEGSDVTLTEESISPSSIQEVLEFTLRISRDSSGNITLKEELPSYVDLNEVYLGFRLLRFMMSSLDVTLFLQHKFFVQEHIMMVCNGNAIEDKGELIIDDIILMCEQILRNSFLIEYSCEKNYLTKNMAMRSPGIMQHQIPMSLSVSHLEQYSIDWISNSYSYQRSHSRHTPRRLKNDLIKFLGSTRHGLRDINWLNQLRKVHRSIFIGSNSPELKNNIMVELLEEVQKAYANISGNTRLMKSQWSDNGLYSLFPEDFLGIRLAVRFGAKLSLLQPTPLVHSNLAQFIKSTYGALKIVRDEFCGFDWFLASVFLLCCGNVDRCRQFINNFVKINVAPFVWATYGEVLSKLNSMNDKYQNDYIFLLIQQVELIISVEVPKVFAAFQSSAASVGVLVHQWISQSFFNILDWSEMKNFLCLIMINEPDYIVYFCVALFLHLEPFILHTVATSSEHLWEQLKINPVCHFHLGNYLYFIEKIHKIHHNSVMRSILKCTAKFE